MYMLKISAIIISTLAIAMTIAPQAIAQIDDQPDELQAIYACKTITAPEERLACYDNSVGRFQAAEKSGNVVAVSKTTIEKVERDAFGFNIPSLPSISGIFGRNNKESDTSKRVKKENDLTPRECKTRQTQRNRLHFKQSPNLVKSLMLH